MSLPFSSKFLPCLPLLSELGLPLRRVRQSPSPPTATASPPAPCWAASIVVTFPVLCWEKPLGEEGRLCWAPSPPRQQHPLPPSSSHSSLGAALTLFFFFLFFFSLMEEVKSSVYLAKKKKIPGIPPAPSLNITKRPSCSPRGELLRRASSTLPREERRQQGALQGPTCSTRTGDVEKTHSSQCSAGQGRGLLCEPRSSPESVRARCPRVRGELAVAFSSSFDHSVYSLGL